MKRLIILLIFICLFGNSAFSLEGFEGDESDNLTGNIGIDLFFPLARNENAGYNILASLLFSSLSRGLGYHFNIIQDVFSPGIYGDVHISWLSLSNLASEDDKKDEKENKNEEKELFIFIQAGLRLYNQFKVKYFDIQPFVGISFALANDISSAAKLFGILIAYKDIGIEYSYHTPLLDFETTMLNNNVHRIAFLIHMR
jgi:hypothetical protein